MEVSAFNEIVSSGELDLPKRWDGTNFINALKCHFANYMDLLEPHISKENFIYIKLTCDRLLNCIQTYHNGFPNKAYDQFSLVMDDLFIVPLAIYNKNGWSKPFTEKDPLNLFRIRKVNENITQTRKEIFHTPYSLRSKVPTCRYSIAGYPSLYLGTSVALCNEEFAGRNSDGFTIVSKFKIERIYNPKKHFEIDVLDLGIKPKDFLSRHDGLSETDTNNVYSKRIFRKGELLESKENYLIWYPLISACSFIRAHRERPFASEYIVPQLLMQWVRNKINMKKLMGIRYFSCASYKASEMGFNYVFPVSGENYKNYCAILVKAFNWTLPVYIHEYETIGKCEEFLINDNNIASI